MANLGLVSVNGSDTLKGVIFAMKLANKELRTTIYAESRQQLGQEWTFALYERATTNLENRVLVQGSRVRVGTQGFSVSAATSVKRLSHGLQPASQWPGIEFGADRQVRTVETHSRSGKAYSVKKNTTAMLKSRRRRGHVVMPAAHEIGLRLVALWVQIVVREYRNSFDGGKK